MNLTEGTADNLRVLPEKLPLESIKVLNFGLTERFWAVFRGEEKVASSSALAHPSLPGP